MKHRTRSGFTLLEGLILVTTIILILVAIILQDIRIKRQKSEARKREAAQSIEVGSNREIFTYSGNTTGVVTRTFEVPGTPTNDIFPVVEVAMTNDNGSFTLHGAFLRSPEELKVGDRVAITVVKHTDIGGGKPIRFVTKIEEK